MSEGQAMEALLARMARTKTNTEFLSSLRDGI
jgi:hypothetical protein